MPASSWNRLNEAVDVGIVVVNRNQGILLERCFRSALAQTFPGRFHEVVVADAASTDFSREAIAGYGNRIVPILLEPPATPAQALWEGIKKTSGRYVVCLRAQVFISDYMILFQAIWLYQNPNFDTAALRYPCTICSFESGVVSNNSRDPSSRSEGYDRARWKIGRASCRERVCQYV